MGGNEVKKSHGPQQPRPALKKNERLNGATESSATVESVPNKNGSAPPPPTAKPSKTGASGSNAGGAPINIKNEARASAKTKVKAKSGSNSKVQVSPSKAKSKALKLKIGRKTDDSEPRKPKPKGPKGKGVSRPKKIGTLEGLKGIKSPPVAAPDKDEGSKRIAAKATKKAGAKVTKKAGSKVTKKAGAKVTKKADAKEAKEAHVKAKKIALHEIKNDVLDKLIDEGAADGKDTKSPVPKNDDTTTTTTTTIDNEKTTFVEPRGKSFRRLSSSAGSGSKDKGDDGNTDGSNKEQQEEETKAPERFRPKRPRRQSSLRSQCSDTLEDAAHAPAAKRSKPMMGSSDSNTNIDAAPAPALIIKRLNSKLKDDADTAPMKKSKDDAGPVIKRRKTKSKDDADKDTTKKGKDNTALVSKRRNSKSKDDAAPAPTTKRRNSKSKDDAAPIKRRNSKSSQTSKTPKRNNKSSSKSATAKSATVKSTAKPKENASSRDGTGTGTGIETSTSTGMSSPELPLIAPQLYHLKVCLPRRRRLARSMQMFIMNNPMFMQDDTAENNEGNQNQTGNRQGEDDGAMMNQSSPANGNNGRGIEGSRGVNGTEQRAMMMKDAMMPNNEMMMKDAMMNGRNHQMMMMDNDGRGNHRSNSAHNANANDSNHNNNQVNNRGFPSVPFQDTLRDGQRNSMEEQAMIRRTRMMYMDAANKERLLNHDNAMMDGQGQGMGGMGGEPDGRGGGGGESNMMGMGMQTQMVATGAPLRGLGDSNGSNDDLRMPSGRPAENRRRSSCWSNFDSMSVGGGGSIGDFAISPAPFKEIMTKDNVEGFFNRMPGMSPLDNANRGDLRERMMMNMMGGPVRGESMGSRGMGGMMGGVGGGLGSAMATPVTSMRHTLGGAPNNSSGNNPAADSLLGKRKFHMEQMMGMGMGDNGASFLKSPMPKKSFLQRERIMESEMKNHMNEAFAGFKKHHHRRTSPGSGGDNRACLGLNNPPSHPNSNTATPHEASMTTDDMVRLMAEKIKRVNLPSLTSPTDGNTTEDIAKNMSIVNANFNPTMGMNPSITDNPLTLPKKTPKKVSTKSSSSSKSTVKQASKKDDAKSKKAKAVDTKARLGELTKSILAATIMPDKPKRPFSAYNLFFQLEREFIKHEISEGRNPMEDPMIKAAITMVDKEGKGKSEGDGADKNDPKDGSAAPASKQEAKKPPGSAQSSQYFDDPNIPTRYSHLRLDKHWYSVGHKQKRKHRKTKGSCGFIELTKMVSARWKTIDDTDPYVKKYCQKLADVELEQYKRATEQYKREVKKVESEAKTKALMEVTQSPEMVLKVKKEPAKKKVDKDDAPMALLASKGSKKKKSKKDKDKATVGEPTLAPDDQPQPTNVDLGYGGSSVGDNMRKMNNNFGHEGHFGGHPAGDMGGNMDMMGRAEQMRRMAEFARMSGSFPGALNARGDGFPPGFCGHFAPAGMGMPQGAAADGVGGPKRLPPPPFADGRSMADVRAAEAARMAEARMAAMGARAAMADDADQLSGADGPLTADARARAAHMAEVRLAGSREMEEEKDHRGEDELVETRMIEARMTKALSSKGRMAEQVKARAEMAAEFARAGLADRGGGDLHPHSRDIDTELVNARSAVVEARKSAQAASDIDQKFSALAEAEARHRMQMEMQGGMMGRTLQHGNGQDRDRQGFGFSRDAEADGMPRHPRDMGQGNFPLGGMRGDVPSPIRRQMMERFGRMREETAGDMPRAMPAPDGSGTDGTGGAQEQQFDMEVERFLSCLGQEIKAKHRKQFMAGGATGADAGRSMLSAGMAGLGGSSLAAEAMARMGAGAEGMGAPPRRSDQMMAGMPADADRSMRSAGMAGLGGSSLAAEAMARMGAGAEGMGAPPRRSDQMMAGMPMGTRAEMMTEMMMRNRGDRSNANYPANHYSPETMAEMMRNSGGVGGHAPNGHSGMMPRPPFDRNDFHRQQQHGSAVGRGGEGEDDNPALPEYGWGRNA